MSSSWQAFKGIGIYKAVENIHNLGFELVELGAAHSYEKDVFQTLNKIKKDFSSMNFTVHAYFPPLFKNGFYVNFSDGLTLKNKKVIDAAIKTGEIMEAKVVSFHSGKNYEVNLGNYSSGKLIKNAKEKFQTVIDYINKKKTDLTIAIENLQDPEKCIFSTVPELKRFFEINPEIGLLWDFGHSTIARWAVEDVLSFGERIKQMHLHGYDGQLDHIPVQNSITNYDFLSNIHIKKIPKILEYNGKVTNEEVLESRNFLKKWL